MGGGQQVRSIGALHVGIGMSSHPLTKKSTLYRAHKDQDFTYSVIEVHVEGEKYGHDDRVVCYFCFPQLGCAVPMRPGDILLMNPMEYHCVSSLCQNDVDVYCVSCYLKTAVVGGNDNKRELNGEESECLGAFDDAVRLMKMNRK